MSNNNKNSLKFIVSGKQGQYVENNISYELLYNIILCRI